MTLYRAKPEDGVAWITGASTGLGRQLALDLASEGYTVAITARDPERMDSMARDAEAMAGRIVGFFGDVTDEKVMDRTVAAIEKQLGPIVLAVFNAGSYYPTHGERLDVYNFRSTFDVNLMGVIHGLVPVADRMRDRGFGQIAIVGSVTSYFGLPSAGAYGGSKAALNCIAQSLRYDFDKLNIRLQMFNPGFIDTPLTKKNKFAMPALMPVGKASARMVRGLKSGGFEVTFPRRLTWALKAMACLPSGLTYRALRLATGWDKRQFGIKRGR